MDNQLFLTEFLTRETELINTLTTLATALSVTADLPTSDQLLSARKGDTRTQRLVDLKIKITFLRVLNALKVREDAS